MGNKSESMDAQAMRFRSNRPAIHGDVVALQREVRALQDELSASQRQFRGLEAMVLHMAEGLEKCEAALKIPVDERGLEESLAQAADVHVAESMEEAYRKFWGQPSLATKRETDDIYRDDIKAADDRVKEAAKALGPHWDLHELLDEVLTRGLVATRVSLRAETPDDRVKQDWSLDSLLEGRRRDAFGQAYAQAARAAKGPEPAEPQVLSTVRTQARCVRYRIAVSDRGTDIQDVGFSARAPFGYKCEFLGIESGDGHVKIKVRVEKDETQRVATAINATPGLAYRWFI